MVVFFTRLALCVLWLGQGYWMIRHKHNVIVTFFSLCLDECYYCLLKDSLITHSPNLDGSVRSSRWSNLRHNLDTCLAFQCLTVPGEVTLGYHHCLGKLLHLNLLHSCVVVCGPDWERCWMSQGPRHAEG